MNDFNLFKELGAFLMKEGLEVTFSFLHEVRAWKVRISFYSEDGKLYRLDAVDQDFYRAWDYAKFKLADSVASGKFPTK